MGVFKCQTELVEVRSIYQEVQETIRNCKIRIV